MAIYRKADATRNAKADAQAALYNGGTLNWYTGAIPTTPATAATGTLLATNTCANPAFGAAVAGVVTYNNDTPNTQIALGNIGYCRVLDSGGGVVADLDVTITAGGGAIEVDKIAVAVNENVTVTSFTITEPM